MEAIDTAEQKVQEVEYAFVEEVKIKKLKPCQLVAGSTCAIFI